MACVLEIILDVTSIAHHPVRACLGLSTLSEEVLAMLEADDEHGSAAREDSVSPMDALLHSGSNEPPLTRLKRTAWLAELWLRGLQDADVSHACAAASRSLTHGEMLPSLFRLYSTSAYSCFVIGVPILERSIGELVAHGACKSANHGTALLRDLITSEELAAEIGHGAAQVLRSFFSPVQVNARNIVWHGFMSATE